MLSTRFGSNFTGFNRLSVSIRNDNCFKLPIVASQSLNSRNISTTTPLQRVKRKQRKYQPVVRKFSEYGDTHRLLRGMCMRGERYGPLVELPDYTFLDGRPTPLTPTQKELMDERQQLAQKVFKDLEEMDTVKDYAKLKINQLKEEKEALIRKKLTPKNTVYHKTSK